MTLETFARNAGQVLQSNATTILTALGVGGVLSTAYLAHEAGRRTMVDLIQKEEDLGRGLTTKEQTALYWKQYIPLAFVASASVTCIIASHTVGARRQAALMSAVTLGEQAFREYREKMVETLGERKEKKVVDEMAAEEVKKNPPSKGDLMMIAEGDILCRDRFSGRYFKTSIPKLEKAEVEINRQIVRMDYAILNDFYELVGLESVDVGDEFGFNHDTPLKLEYSSALFNEDPILVVGFRKRPTLHPYKVWQ